MSVIHFRNYILKKARSATNSLGRTLVGRRAKREHISRRAPARLSSSPAAHFFPPSTAHVSHSDGTVREHIARRPSPAAPSASVAAVAAAAAASPGGVRAFRRAAGVPASAGAAAYTASSGATNIGVGVGVGRLHRLCGRHRRRGGRRCRRRPSPAPAHLRQPVHDRHRAKKVKLAARGPRGGQRGCQADDVPALFTPSGWWRASAAARAAAASPNVPDPPWRRGGG